MVAEWRERGEKERAKRRDLASPVAKDQKWASSRKRRKRLRFLGVLGAKTSKRFGEGDKRRENGVWNVSCGFLSEYLVPCGGHQLKRGFLVPRRFSGSEKRERGRDNREKKELAARGR
jgi:hypothetical protein